MGAALRPPEINDLPHAAPNGVTSTEPRPHRRPPTREPSFATPVNQTRSPPMSEALQTLPAAANEKAAVEQTALKVLVAISVAHMLNDIMQALIPSTYAAAARDPSPHLLARSA